MDSAATKLQLVILKGSKPTLFNRWNTQIWLPPCKSLHVINLIAYEYSHLPSILAREEEGETDVFKGYTFKTL